MLHIHLVPESPAGGPHWACAEIRLLRPYRHPLLKTLVKTTVGSALPSSRVDAVVVQRRGPPGASFGALIDLVREVRTRGVPLIYDIDDDLLSEHPSPQIEKRLRPQRPFIRFLLAEADLVTVSTDVLASRFARFNANIRVWANALDESLAYARAESGREGADLGYFGTASHLEDLLDVTGSLQCGLSTLSAKPTAEVCGVDEDARAALVLAQYCEIATLPVVGSYAQFMKSFQERDPWKAGIAPLADNVFNRAKSDIKFLDYCMFGIPSIYSSGEVYSEVEHGETGLVADPDEWGGMTLMLIEDLSLRRRLRQNSYEYLMQRRTLRHSVRDLYDIVNYVA